MKNISRKRKNEQLPRNNVVQFPKNKQVILPTKNLSEFCSDTERVDLNELFSEGNQDPLFISVPDDAEILGISGSGYVILDTARPIKPSEIVLYKHNGYTNFKTAEQCPDDCIILGVVTHVIKNMGVTQ